MSRYLFGCIHLGFLFITPSTSIFSSNLVHARAHVLDCCTILSIIDSGKERVHTVSIEGVTPATNLNLGRNLSFNTKGVYFGCDLSQYWTLQAYGCCGIQFSCATMVLSSALRSFGDYCAILSFFLSFFFYSSSLHPKFSSLSLTSLRYLFLFLAIPVWFCIIFRQVISFFVVDSGAGCGRCIAGWFGLPTVSYIPSFAYSFCCCYNATRRTSSESLLLYTICQFLAC